MKPPTYPVDSAGNHVYPPTLAREIRFNYFGMTNAEVVAITGARPDYVAEVRRGRRGFELNNVRVRDRWHAECRGTEARLFFIRSAMKLIALHNRVMTELADDGDFVDPVQAELDVPGRYKQAGNRDLHLSRKKADPAAAPQPPAAPTRSEGFLYE